MVGKRACGRILSESLAHFQESSSQIFIAGAMTIEASREATAVAGLQLITKRSTAFGRWVFASRLAVPFGKQGGAAVCHFWVQVGRRGVIGA
jgi:hypothetical protein